MVKCSGTFLIVIAVLFTSVMPAAAAPDITWSPTSINQTLETGKATTLSASFSLAPSVGVLDVNVDIVPALRDFVAVTPTSFSGLTGGETRTVTITISAPLAFPPGFHSGTVKLRDAAGGSSTISGSPLQVTLTIVEDVTRPVVEIIAPETGSVFAAGPVTVEGTLDDPFAELTVNGEPVSVNGGLWTTLVALDEGTNFISAIARDQVSNVGTDAIEITLDTRPPVIVIDSPADGFVSSEPFISVAGMINDIVVGTVGGDQALVTVNGIVAEVANRSFLAQSVPLVPGVNTITAVGEDRAGNVATDVITVIFEEITAEPQITLVSGNNQTGLISGLLTQPLIVALKDATGSPVAGENVIFKVIENNGTVTTGAASSRSLIAVTDAQGLAQVSWTLGTRAGAGNNIVEAVAVGFAGTALFTATALPAAADKINVDAGNNQTGAVGEPLPGPLAVAVTDAGHNRLADVPVTFTVVKGEGTFSGLSSITVDTDGNGRALALLTLGPDQGFDNNVVEADYPGNLGLPARFVASGRIAGDPAATRISGVVLDNTNVPIAGVTLSIEGTGLSAQSDAEGQFVISEAPVGHLLLHADGGTAQRPGTWPSLEFELVTVAGQDNRLGMPIYLLPLDIANELCVDEVTGGTLTLPGMPGFSLTVEAGSATFLDGSKAGCISVTRVHADKVPMTPNFGQQPRFIITIQPAGVLFDPPAPMTLPNTDGLAPGQVTELYSFDHDLGQFVSIGTGTVSEDGLVVATDSGVGVLKAGWHCGGDPVTTGGGENAHVEILQLEGVSITSGILTCLNETVETALASGSPQPPGDPAYVWAIQNENIISVAFNSQDQPNIPKFTGLTHGETNASVEYMCLSGATARAQVPAVAVEILQDTELWYFNGEDPPSFTEGAIEVVLQAQGATSGTFSWEILEGQTFAEFENGSNIISKINDNTARLRSKLGSSARLDIRIRLTIDGFSGHCDFRTESLTPKSAQLIDILDLAVDCSTFLPTNEGYASFIQYRWLDQFGEPTSGEIEVNEFLGNHIDLIANNWPAPVSSGAIQDSGVLADLVCVNGSQLSPQPLPPQSPLTNTRVDSTFQQLFVGSDIPSRGVLVQSHDQVRYQDHGRHE